MSFELICRNWIYFTFSLWFFFMSSLYLLLLLACSYNVFFSGDIVFCEPTFYRPFLILCCSIYHCLNTITVTWTVLLQGVRGSQYVLYTYVGVMMSSESEWWSAVGSGDDKIRILAFRNNWNCSYWANSIITKKKCTWYFTCEIF